MHISRGNAEEAGTLEGWLMLNRPGRPPGKVAFTCYHLVANSPAGQQEIDYPAALDLNNSIKKVEALSAKPGCRPETLNTLNKLKMMTQNALIGRVVATSGKRLNAAGRRTDWALIQVIDDETRNRPPSPTNLRPAALYGLYPEGGKVYYEVTPDSLIRQFGTMKKDSWVKRIGGRPRSPRL